MTEKPRETQAELHVVELKEQVNNSSLMKHPRSIPTEPNRVVGTCIRGAKPITDDVLFQTTFLFAADVLTLPVKDLDRAARGTLGRSVSARSTDASLLTRPSSC